MSVGTCSQPTCACSTAGPRLETQRLCWPGGGQGGAAEGVEAKERQKGCWAGSPSRLSAPLPATSLLLCSQGSKVLAMPAPDGSGDASASDEWVFERKVSGAEGGTCFFALSPTNVF